jgi:23S rRNA (pseudouridine1915-N3)-methyltransferase
MRIKIIAVGKLKEMYWKSAVDEYLKRLSGYAKVEITEVAGEKERNNPYPCGNRTVERNRGRADSQTPFASPACGPFGY